MGLPESIKMLRAELGLSQCELADKLDVNIGTVVRWENGHSYPKKKITDRILGAIETMDITENCKKAVKQSLSQGRRQSASAEKYGFPKVDQDLLCRIVDESANAVYAIEVETHKVLYANKTTEKLAMEKYNYKEIQDKTCYEYIANRKSPCKDCPLKNIKGYEFSEHMIMHRGTSIQLRVRGRKMKWNGKDIFITYVSVIGTEKEDASYPRKKPAQED